MLPAFFGTWGQSYGVFLVLANFWGIFLWVGGIFWGGFVVFLWGGGG